MRVTADQAQTAGLVQECTMFYLFYLKLFRDGLVRLPDESTVERTLRVICVHIDCSLLSISLFFFLFFCTLCTIYIINDAVVIYVQMKISNVCKRVLMKHKNAC